MYLALCWGNSSEQNKNIGKSVNVIYIKKPEKSLKMPKEAFDKIQLTFFIFKHILNKVELGGYMLDTVGQNLAQPKI